MAEASSSAPEAGQAPVAPLCEAAASEKISIDCAICLDVVKEGGTIDSCIHIFCFKCILDWSKVTNKCPICNSNFKKITEQIDEEVSQLDAKDKKRKRKRKPKTVKVQSRQQHVSYDYTGTFAGYSDDDDDSDYFSDDSEDMFGHVMGRMLMGHFISSFHASDGGGVFVRSCIPHNNGGVIDLTADSEDEEEEDSEYDTGIDPDEFFGHAIFREAREIRGHSLFDQHSIRRPGTDTAAPARRVRAIRVTEPVQSAPRSTSRTAALAAVRGAASGSRTNRNNRSGPITSENVATASAPSGSMPPPVPQIAAPSRSALAGPSRTAAATARGAASGSRTNRNNRSGPITSENVATASASPAVHVAESSPAGRRRFSGIIELSDSDDMNMSSSSIDLAGSSTTRATETVSSSVASSSTRPPAARDPIQSRVRQRQSRIKNKKWKVWS